MVLSLCILYMYLRQSCPYNLFDLNSMPNSNLFFLLFLYLALGFKLQTGGLWSVLTTHFDAKIRLNIFRISSFTVMVVFEKTEAAYHTHTMPKWGFHGQNCSLSFLETSLSVWYSTNNQPKLISPHTLMSTCTRFLLWIEKLSLNKQHYIPFISLLNLIYDN